MEIQKKLKRDGLKSGGSYSDNNISNPEPEPKESLFNIHEWDELFKKDEIDDQHFEITPLITINESLSDIDIV